MTALFRVEVRRLLARRITRILAVAVLALTLLVLLRVFTASSRTVDEGARARNAAEQQEFVRQCEAAKARGEVSPQDPCEYHPFEDSDRRLHGEDALKGGAYAVTVVMIMVALVVGASSVGAEWNAGTMQALLYWEPRRPRVLLAKGAALLVVLAAFTLAYHLVVYAGIYGTAATRGTTEGVTGGLHVSNLLLMLRGFLCVAVSGLFGFAIAGISRVTAGALGAGFAYFLGDVIYVRQFRPGWIQYLPTQNMGSVIAKSTQVLTGRSQVVQGPPGIGGYEQEVFLTLGGVRGAVTLGIYVAVVLGAFFLSFTRRDVT